MDDPGLTVYEYPFDNMVNIFYGICIMDFELVDCRIFDQAQVVTKTGSTYWKVMETDNSLQFFKTRKLV